MAAEKPCELVRAVTRVLPRDNFARDNLPKGQFFQGTIFPRGRVRLWEGAVTVLDYTGMDNPEPPC